MSSTSISKGGVVNPPSQEQGNYGRCSPKCVHVHRLRGWSTSSVYCMCGLTLAPLSFHLEPRGGAPILGARKNVKGRALAQG